jgi:hypothetical protein
MHLLSHAGAWSLPTYMPRIWMLAWAHWVAWWEARVLGHANLMGRKWLRHHHRCLKKSPNSGFQG